MVSDDAEVGTVNALRVDFVRPVALWQGVVGALRRAIVIGELEPGMRLKEVTLAEHFGVSRLPVREAVTQLEREGLVTFEPRRGAYVVGVTEKDIHETYECRLLLEVAAIKHTVKHIDEQGIADLRALVAQMDAGIAAGRVQAVAASDMAFHRLLISMAGNRALARAWEPLAPLIETALSIADETVPDLPGAMHGHLAIIGALEQRDADTAASLLSADLPGGERLVHEAIRRVREERGTDRGIFNSRHRQMDGHAPATPA
jgi:DNA-binding GntR family transcriptional regulator